MKQVTVATIQLFGGHPALDFTNTVDSRGSRFGPDVLQRFEDLRTWALRRGVIDAAEAERLGSVPDQRGRRALKRAKALREALYRVFSTRAAGTADLLLLRREFQAAQRARTIEAAGERYTWQWGADDADTITHRIALEAVDLLVAPSLGRVHVCPGENCGWLFLDTSRSGRRLWCSEETCGRRDRIRRWRVKHRNG
jgi:predicted RNA-binding Zn ribbon-like protein